MIHEQTAGSYPLKIGVLAVGTDAGVLLEGVVGDLRAAWGPGGEIVVHTAAVDDDPAAFGRVLRRWCDRERMDVVCTVGRSGPCRGDFVPDLTASLLERTLPGVEERMYLANPRRADDLLFRGRAGIRKLAIVINLPARPGRIRTILGFLAAVLPHAMEKIHGSDRECGRPEGAR